MEANIDCNSARETNDTELEIVYINEGELISSFNLENHDGEIIVDGSFFISEENSLDLDGKNVHLQEKETTLDDTELMAVSLENDIDNGMVNNFENKSDLDGKNVHLQNKENTLDDTESKPVSIKTDIDNGSMNNCEEIPDLDEKGVELQNKENIFDDSELMSVRLEKDVNNGTVNNYEIIPDQLENNYINIEVNTIDNENTFIENSQPAVLNLPSMDQTILVDRTLSSLIDSEQISLLVLDQDSSMVHAKKKTSRHLQSLPRKSWITPVSKHAHNFKLQPSLGDPFICPYCKREFSKKRLLKKHMMRMHKFPASDSVFLCYYCNALYVKYDLLQKHYEDEHKFQHQTALAMARKYSADPSSLYNVKKIDKGCNLKKLVVSPNKYDYLQPEIPPSIEKDKYDSLQLEIPPSIEKDKYESLQPEIPPCIEKDKRPKKKKKPSKIPPDIEKDNRDITPSTIPPDIEKDNTDILSSTIPQDIDGSKPAPPTKSYIGRIKCIECNMNCLHFRAFREHLLKHHNLDVSEKEIRFPNMTAFKKWKLDIERRELTFFSAQTGAKKLSSYIYRRYCCHRSGYRDKLVENKNRVNNLIGSSKTGFFCTASMTAYEYPHEVLVKYCLQHYGHGGGVTFGHLSNDQQVAIQENVFNGIPLEEQLNDIKDTQSSAEHFQAQRMKKRDISFIDRAFASEVYNAGMNATEYVEQWVRTCSEMEDSPILLYRHEGIGTKSEDLMLIIMTEFQKHILMTSSKQVVSLAFPNRNKKGHNLLTALVVIDDQEVAFPVAFCICNIVNKSTMVEFLSSVKESTGPLSFSYFMSNDDKFFYEAWQEVMQDESKWVWSIWSFDDRIRKLLMRRKSAIKDVDTREDTYRLFRTIIECNSQPVFSTMFKNFKISLLENVKTIDFGKHFVSQYDSNPEMWACCYRKDIKLNTNLFIEYLYKIMQYCIRITRTIQLDKFLMVVMKWLRCKMLDRLSNMLDEDKINLAKNTISMCHNMGLEIECENVVSLSDKIWLIRSQNEVEVYVTQEYESCPELCDLRCSDCDVCVHMYSCSCAQSLIHANMCPHVHAVVWKFLTPHFSPPASPMPDPCDDVDDISADVQTKADIEPDLLKGVLKRMEGVYKQVRINKCKLNKSSLSEVLRLLNRCYQICSCDENPPHLLSESTQTESTLPSKHIIDDNLDFKSKIDANIPLESNIEEVPVRLSNRVLKDLDNTLSISYPSSKPVLAFNSVLPPVRGSSNLPLNSGSVSLLKSELTSKSLNNAVSSSAGRHKNIVEDALNAALSNKILGKVSKSCKKCKKFTLVPRGPLKTPLSNVLNSAVQKREKVNFKSVLSPKYGSGKVGRINLIPSNHIPSSSFDSVSNNIPVSKKHHIERTSVPDVVLMKNSSNVSDSIVRNSPLIVKTIVSSSNTAPSVSTNAESNSVSCVSSVIDPTTAKSLVSKNNFDRAFHSIDQVLCITVPDPSLRNVTDSILLTPAGKPTTISDSTLKNHSEVKDNSIDQVLCITGSDASVNNVTSSVLLTPVGKPTTISDSTLKNHSEVKVNSINQVLCITGSDASVNNVTSVLLPPVGKPTTTSDSILKNHSEVKDNSIDQVLCITGSDASVNNVTNSVLLTAVGKPTVSDLKSKNHSEMKAKSTDQVLYITVPDDSVNTASNSVLQVASVAKPTTMPVLILNNNFDSKTGSASEKFYIAVPDTSVNILSNSASQSSLAIKPAAAPGLKLSNNSNKTCFTDNLLYVILPDVPPNTGLGLASQTPSVESTTVSVSMSNKDSNVTELSSSHALPVLLSAVSTNAGSNFTSQTPVIFSNNGSDKSDKIRRIPILSSNSVPNATSKYNPIANRSLIKRNYFSGGPLLKDSSNISSDPVINSPFNVKTTVLTSDNLPAVSDNTQLNYVSRRKPVAKKRRIERTSVPDVPLMKNSSNVSSDTGTNSPLIVKTTVSLSANLPALSVSTESNSVSEVSSAMLASTSNNDSTDVLKNYLFSSFKVPDEMSNSSDFQLVTSSSFKSCQEKTDALQDIAADGLKPSDHITNSVAENCDAARSSQAPASTPNKLPGYLQFVWTPVTKKRYVVKARIPFTPMSNQSSISSGTEVDSVSESSPVN